MIKNKISLLVNWLQHPEVNINSLLFLDEYFEKYSKIINSRLFYSVPRFYKLFLYHNFAILWPIIKMKFYQICGLRIKYFISYIFLEMLIVFKIFNILNIWEFENVQNKVLEFYLLVRICSPHLDSISQKCIFVK